MGGSLRQRGGVIYAIYDAVPGPDGKRRQKWLPCRHSDGTPMSMKQARTMLRGILTDIARGAHIDSESTLLSAFLAHWLGIIGPNLAATTLERYRDLVRLHINPALGHLRLDRIKPMHVEDCLSRLKECGRLDGKPGGLAPKTCRHIHTLLHTALRQAVRWQVIAINPVDAVAPPRVPRPQVRTASVDDIAKLLVAIDSSRFRIPILLALSTGMRRGEICGLRWEDFDADRCLLTINRSIAETSAGYHVKHTKTDKPRQVLLSEELVSELETWRAIQEERGYTDRWICRNAHGNLLMPKLFGLRFRRLCRSVGVEVTLHGLRHTQATNLIMAGVPVRIVAERLGHSTVRTTQDVYTHVMPSDQRQAVEVIERMLRRKTPPIHIVES